MEWRTIDDAKINSLPRGELRKALADGANELLFWKRVGDRFLVRGDYVIPERLRSLRQARGDDETYASISQEQFSAFIPVDGDSPIWKRLVQKRTIAIPLPSSQRFEV